MDGSAGLPALCCLDPQAVQVPKLANRIPGVLYLAQLSALRKCPAKVTRMLFVCWPEVAKRRVGEAAALPQDPWNYSDTTQSYLYQHLVHDVERSMQTPAVGRVVGAADRPAVDAELVQLATEVVQFAPELVESSLCISLLRSCPSDAAWSVVRPLWQDMWKSATTHDLVSCFDALQPIRQPQACRDVLLIMNLQDSKQLNENPAGRSWLEKLLREARREKNLLLPERDWARERLLLAARGSLGRFFRGFCYPGS